MMATNDQIRCAACFGTGLASRDTNAAHDAALRKANDDGAFEERLRVVDFIRESMPTLRDFAGDRADELAMYMLMTMSGKKVLPTA